ncbi:MAG: 6-carboxy-5,6,7,8-tetrahydropterin synthase [Succiniclasticum sp.]|jgi:6-pyruvoyltetrahydropterin/6-carboxytetrahydropterin synthase
MKVLKEFEFDAAHYLPSYNGKCEHLHGHTYRLVVMVDGSPDAEGMVIDFTKLKQIVKERVLAKMDHQLLNNLLPNPSAENIAMWVWDQLEEPLSASNRHLYEVQVWETRTNGCIYNGEFHKGEPC